MRIGSAILTAISLVALTIGTPGPLVSAAGGPPDIERFVFVHYPAAPALPDVVHQAKQGAGRACPDPSTCSDNKWSGYAWPSKTASYELNVGGSPLGTPTTEAAVQASFAAWVNATGNALTVNGGSSTSTSCSTAGTTRNEVNQVCWRDITAQYPHAIAVTFIWASRSTKSISEADIVFNSGLPWAYTDPGSCDAYTTCNTAGGAEGAYDVRNIGTHEAGHFLALFGDLYTARDAELTMYGYGATRELWKDSLGKGDCLGITQAYGGTCPQ